MPKNSDIPRRRGFTLPEILVVFGVIAIIFALVLPAFSAGRTRTKEVLALSNARQLGMMVEGYAADHNDLPPVVYSPTYRRVPPEELEPWRRSPRDPLIPGAWFNNGLTGFYAMSPLPPAQVLRAPGGPNAPAIFMDGQATSHYIDYKIADTYYAQSDYWTREKQAGPSQWRVQTLGSVAFPSSKGMLRQMRVWDPMSDMGWYPGCCWGDAPSSVIWADLSGTTTVQRTLRPGVPNNWHHGAGSSSAVWATGSPIDATELGVLGRDR